MKENRRLYQKPTFVDPRILAVVVITALIVALTVYEYGVINQNAPQYIQIVSLPSPTLDVAVKSLAAKRHISWAEAQQRLTWQQRTPKLERELRSILGDNFGGVWIAPEDGDRVKVGVVGEVGTRPALTADVQSAVEQNGLAGATDLVTVRYSLAHLESIIGWLASDLEKVNAGADWPLSSELRTNLNAVELRLPSRGKLTSAQKAVVAKAKARYGEALQLDTYDYRPQAQ